MSPTGPVRSFPMTRFFLPRTLNASKRDDRLAGRRQLPYSRLREVRADLSWPCHADDLLPARSWVPCRRLFMLIKANRLVLAFIVARSRQLSTPSSWRACQDKARNPPLPNPRPQLKRKSKPRQATLFLHSVSIKPWHAALPPPSSTSAGHTRKDIMKKLGLGKKKGEAEEDSSRLALFGSRTKS
jgi:hypothetical protein